MIKESKISTIYFAGGCFWGVQKFFDQFPGIIKTTVGYANGPKQNPSYEEVCSGIGHAETVKIMYDNSKINLKKLLEYYFMIIDPLSLNKQGNDIGIQYRTGIYYENEEQKKDIEEIMNKMKIKYGKTLAVEVSMIQNFSNAEEYHQKYLEKNIGGYCHIPKKMFSLYKKV